MVEQSQQPEVEVTVIPPSEPEPDLEPVAEAVSEAAETAASAETEIAEIRAAESVAVASINADVEKERIAAQERAAATVVQNEDEKWQEVASLREQVQTLSETVGSLAAQLTPQPSPEEPNNSTPPSTLVETSETPMEVIPESVGERPGLEAEAIVRRVRRAI